MRGAVWARCCALMLAVVGLWSLATPLSAAPDEYGQLFAAAAVVRNAPSTVYDTGFGDVRAVQIPEDLRPLHTLQDCYVNVPTSPAGCPETDDPTPAITQFLSYPRPYFLLTGLPTLVLHGKAAWVGARAVSVLLCSLLLGTALWMQRRWWRTGRSGAALLVASTPLVLNQAAVLGPSGLEISAGLASSVGLVLLARLPGPAPRSLLVATAVSLGALVECRALSPLWAAALVLAALFVAGWSRVRELAGDRSVLVATACVGVVTATAVAWTLVKGQPPLLGYPVPELSMRSKYLDEAFKQVKPLWSGRIGRFGWGDVQIPDWSIAVWVVLAVLLGGLAVASVRGRGAWQELRAVVAAALVLLAVTAAPIVLQRTEAPKVGLFWAPRYDLPLAVMAPLLLAGLPAVVRGPGAERRGVPAVVGLVLVGAVTVQVVAFVHALHRYATGLSHPLPLLGRTAWEPFLGWQGLTLLFLLVLVGWVAVAAGWRPRRGWRQTRQLGLGS